MKIILEKPTRQELMVNFWLEEFKSGFVLKAKRIDEDISWNILRINKSGVYLCAGLQNSNLPFQVNNYPNDTRKVAERETLV